MDFTREQYHRLEITKAYVALSNVHRLDLIFGLFADHATYDSSNVGLYEGKPAITSMMTAFFVQFPDVAWDIRNLRVDSQEPNTIAFEFLMTATEPKRGTPIHRSGNERIVFSEFNLIERVLVKNIK